MAPNEASVRGRNHLEIVTTVAAAIGCATGVTSLAWAIIDHYSTPREVLTAEWGLAPKAICRDGIMYKLTVQVTNLGDQPLFVRDVSMELDDNMISIRPSFGQDSAGGVPALADLNIGSFEDVLTWEPVESGQFKVFALGTLDFHAILRKSKRMPALYIQTSRGREIEARPVGLWSNLPLSWDLSEDLFEAISGLARTYGAEDFDGSTEEYLKRPRAPSGDE